MIGAPDLWYELSIPGLANLVMNPGATIPASSRGLAIWSDCTKDTFLDTSGPYVCIEPLSFIGDPTTIPTNQTSTLFFFSVVMVVKELLI